MQDGFLKPPDGLCGRFLKADSVLASPEEALSCHMWTITTSEELQ